VDHEAAARIVVQAKPQATEISPVEEPPNDAVPSQVKEALGPGRPISDKLWQALHPLDRYALAKVCARGRERRIQSAYEEIIGHGAVSTHVRPQGGVHMVSIAHKQATLRRAVAECWVTMSREAWERLTRHSAPKGDVLGTARLAGIMATKKTSELIPLCHPLSLRHAEVDLEVSEQHPRIRVTCKVEVFAPTGVEMEAMTGATVAALTVYDMLKSTDRAMSLGPCRLLEKSGGNSGEFRAESVASDD
jgi:cyclic pyranopterin phosphate synthase